MYNIFVLLSYGPKKEKQHNFVMEPIRFLVIKEKSQQNLL
jgi:hypothetical protein